MARDCPDRQRGQDWRQNPTPTNGGLGGPAGAGRPRIEGGDAQEREYASLMQEISGGGPIGDNMGAARIEAGPGGYDDGAAANGYGAGQDPNSLKPWQRGPTGAPAPWHRGREQNPGSGGLPPWQRGGGAPGAGPDNNYGSGGGAGGPPAPWAQQGAPAPWQQQQQQPGPPSGGQQGYGGYAGYGAPGYGDQSGGYQVPGMGAPPGLGAPPGMGMYGGYGQGHGETPPPPPPSAGAPPPPPPGDAPPPPVCVC